jgi:hypothetical protein
MMPAFISTLREKCIATSAVMRTRRLHLQGSPQLQAAVATGLITAYRAGEIAKLPIREQEIAVIQWSNRSLRRTEGQAIATAVIREELIRSDSKIDLDRVVTAIKRAITNSTLLYPS